MQGQRQSYRHGSDGRAQRGNLHDASVAVALLLATLEGGHDLGWIARRHRRVERTVQLAVKRLVI
ncbi:MAG: hypothetical protein JOZ37_16180 [Actinobacteria bacterium]|nr:hypothetical protein [Actinomycetota bacterium]MBV9665508.1 hypothetical protein [Actinomycetota bacterium]MBV9932923.1 hypothetical protein [Actinomycetota bacterium]